MKKILCGLLLLISITLSINCAFATESDNLISYINQCRIGYMTERLNADSDFVDSMFFTFSSEVEGDEFYRSMLNETIMITTENGEIVEVFYITPVAYPLPQTEDLEDIARILGLVTVVQGCEILYGGADESASTVANQLINYLAVKSAGTIETDNMTLEFHCDYRAFFDPDAFSKYWNYEMTRK